MIPEKIENCIVKYFCHSADIEDLDLLNNWISHEENISVFKDYVNVNFAINLAMNDPHLDNIKSELLKKIRREKHPFYKFRTPILKYAAVAVLFLFIGLAGQMIFQDEDNSEQIIPRTDAITLDLGNGEVEIISENGDSKVQNSQGKILGRQKGSLIIYNKDDKENNLVYNTLRIPNGKQFNILLSDGTKVHLNSGSSLTYPTNFIKNMPRKVTLKGEAYFDVAHDEINKFIVNTQELNVQVYGTKFNVSNYPESENTEVVLVQGSVSMSNSTTENTYENDEFFLTPGYKGTFNKINRNITNEKVNTALYTSWMDGNLVFRNTPFEDIIQRLERSYNVVIINNNKKLAKESFNATIETKHETIEQVLNYFNKVYHIEYSIIENKIIIN